MSCNSAIYTVNTASPVITTANSQFATIPFGSVIRRFGRCLGLDGNSIVACGSGYFDCQATVTLTPTAAGPVTVQLFKDGNPVPGAFATITGAASSPTSLSLAALVRNCGCDCNSTLSVRVNASCTINNIAFVAERV